MKALNLRFRRNPGETEEEFQKRIEEAVIKAEAERSRSNTISTDNPSQQNLSNEIRLSPIHQITVDQIHPPENLSEEKQFEWILKNYGEDLTARYILRKYPGPSQMNEVLTELEDGSVGWSPM